MRKLIALALLLCLLVGCEPQTPNKCPGPCPCPRPNAVQDGSVLFWDSGILVRPIYRNTGSTLTHAAIILYVGDEPWVYEAVPPRVRRVPLNTYRKKMKEKEARLREFSWFIMQPQPAYTASELLAMKKHADLELGRQYMMRGWWRGHIVRGIFCSQLVADIIEQSGRITSDNIKESPGSLHAKLTPLYQ